MSGLLLIKPFRNLYRRYNYKYCFFRVYFVFRV